MPRSNHLEIPPVSAADKTVDINDKQQIKVNLSNDSSGTGFIPFPDNLIRIGSDGGLYVAPISKGVGLTAQVMPNGDTEFITNNTANSELLRFPNALLKKGLSGQEGIEITFPLDITPYSNSNTNSTNVKSALDRLFDLTNSAIGEYNASANSPLLAPIFNNLQGTVSVSNGTNYMVGNGTSFTIELQVGSKVLIRGIICTITEVVSDTRANFDKIITQGFSGNTIQFITGPSFVKKGDLYTVTDSGDFIGGKRLVEGNALVAKIDFPVYLSDWAVIGSDFDPLFTTNPRPLRYFIPSTSSIGYRGEYILDPSNHNSTSGGELIDDDWAASTNNFYKVPQDGLYDFEFYGIAEAYTNNIQLSLGLDVRVESGAIDYKGGAGVSLNTEGITTLPVFFRKSFQLASTSFIRIKATGFSSRTSATGGITNISIKVTRIK